jgi:AraC family transcriptional regulator of adaptative response / DNA-3-methyladenine glycosylase II
VTLECDDLRVLPQAVDRIRRVFDLTADPAAIERGLSAEPRLAELVAQRPGLRIPGAWDAFEAGVRAILGQQVSVEGATKAAAKLAGICVSEGCFPTAREVLDADLDSLGGPAARRNALRALADAFASGAIHPDHDFDQARAALEAVPGVGPWTAQYVALRALGDPDAFPASDLVLRRAWGGTARELTEAAERWRPWRSYAAVHLWRSQA